MHAKQQARLTVKRQQAITTHLGRVLETTEEYTRWLTEGIAGTANPQTTNTATGACASESAPDLPDSDLQSNQLTDSASELDLGSGQHRKKERRRQRLTIRAATGSSDSEFTVSRFFRLLLLNNFVILLAVFYLFTVFCDMDLADHLGTLFCYPL